MHPKAHTRCISLHFNLQPTLQPTYSPEVDNLPATPKSAASTRHKPCCHTARSRWLTADSLQQQLEIIGLVSSLTLCLFILCTTIFGMHSKGEPKFVPYALFMETTFCFEGLKHCRYPDQKVRQLSSMGLDHRASISIDGARSLGGIPPIHRPQYQRQHYSLQ